MSLNFSKFNDHDAHDGHDEIKYLIDSNKLEY